MSAQLVAFALPAESLHHRALRGWAYPVAAKARRYFDRTPYWLAREIRDALRRQTDWEFMRAHGYNPKRWDT